MMKGRLTVWEFPVCEMESRKIYQKGCEIYKKVLEKPNYVNRLRCWFKLECYYTNKSKCNCFCGTAKSTRDCEDESEGQYSKHIYYSLNKFKAVGLINKQWSKSYRWMREAGHRTKWSAGYVKLERLMSNSGLRYADDNNDDDDT